MAGGPRHGAPGRIRSDERERAIAVGRSERPSVDPFDLFVRMQAPDPHVQRLDIRRERDPEGHDLLVVARHAGDLDGG